MTRVPGILHTVSRLHSPCQYIFAESGLKLAPFDSDPVREVIASAPPPKLGKTPRGKDGDAEH